MTNENETVADIVAKIREGQNPIYWARPNGEQCDTEETWMLIADRIEAAHKREADELEKQQAYDRKLEADFESLMKDRNALAEKNRDCCAENERLRGTLEYLSEFTKDCANPLVNSIHEYINGVLKGDAK